ncbi:MAG: carboxypeptidase regulatory-like domain-containing protein, partial [Candidatus Polarisedimenticolia bacterium]
MQRITRREGRPGPLAILLVLAVAGGAGAREASGRAWAGRPLIEALQHLQAGGLRLVYSSDVVTAAMLVKQEPPGRDPREVLDALLAPHGLESREGPGGTLLVVRREATRATGAIVGVVRTRRGHRPVAAARVLAEGTGLQALTAEDGRFLIAGLPAGTYTLIVQAPGLRLERFEGVVAGADGPAEVTLGLKAVPALLERIVVTPGRNPSIDRRPDSARSIEGGAFERTAAVGDDLFRALAAQPGIVSADLSAQVGVHGGEPGEVLILLDGLELHDPFHLRTFQRFSGIIDALSVGGAEYYACDYPVQYGDRMGGVLDLSSSNPTAPGRTSVGSSFINSRFMTEGTFREGAGNWLVSARAWHPDSVVRTVDREGEGFAPSYYDLMGKVQIPVGERTVLAANLLASGDEVEFIDPDGEEAVNAGSGNRYAWLTLKSLWSQHLYSRTMVSFGRIQSRRDGRIDEGAEFSAVVHDRRAFDVLDLAQDWSYGPSERLLVRWG